MGREDWMIIGKFFQIRIGIETWNDRRLHVS